MTPPLVSGPIPPYSNPPIQPQNYQPSRFQISDITLGQTTTVTTTTNMNYVIGQLVRLIIPQYFGCWALNEIPAYVISISSPNQVVLQLDSSQNVNEFMSSSAPNQPQIVAVGDVNTGAINSNGANIQITNIPGSFLNIS